MRNLVTKELMHLQKKLELLETKEYKELYTEEQLDIFTQDIKLTMGLLLKREINRIL